MRRRAVALLIAALTAGALVVGAAAEGSASVSAKGAPLCAGKTKAKAVKDITKAYTAFLDGKKYPTSADKEPYLEGTSGKKINAAFKAAFEASASANAAAAATTSVKVNKVTCTGKKSANVAFDLVLGGTPSPGLAPPGTAKILDNRWKVTSLTVCNLQALGDPSLLDKPPCSDIVAAG